MASIALEAMSEPSFNLRGVQCTTPWLLAIGDRVGSNLPRHRHGDGRVRLLGRRIARQPRDRARHPPRPLERRRIGARRACEGGLRSSRPAGVRDRRVRRACHGAMCRPSASAARAAPFASGSSSTRSAARPAPTSRPTPWCWSSCAARLGPITVHREAKPVLSRPAERAMLERYRDCRGVVRPRQMRQLHVGQCARLRQPREARRAHPSARRDRRRVVRISRLAGTSDAARHASTGYAVRSSSSRIAAIAAISAGSRSR
jgi:hypothetical protein